ASSAFFLLSSSVILPVSSMLPVTISPLRYNGFSAVYPAVYLLLRCPGGLLVLLFCYPHRLGPRVAEFPDKAQYFVQDRGVFPDVCLEKPVKEIVVQHVQVVRDLILHVERRLELVYDILRPDYVFMGP